MSSTVRSRDLEEHTRALHEKAFVFDACFSTPGFFRDERAEIQAFLDGGVNGGNATVAEFSHNFTRAIDSIFRHKKLAERNSDQVSFCGSVAELEKCKREGKVGFVVHFQDTKCIEDDLDYLRLFHALGLRVLQLTYNTQGFVGSGCCERHDAGLSSFGLEVVDECNRLGIVIDLSHCGHATTRDAIERSKDPVAFTHVGIYSLCPAYGRNKPDELLKAVAESGGVVGITFFAPLVKRNSETQEVLQGSLEDVLDQIDYAVELLGVDHVGIGTDLTNYFARTLELPPTSSIRSYRPLRPDVFGAGPTDRYDPWPTGLDSHTKMMNLTRGLLTRGYRDDDVLKILGGNWLRLFSEVWRQ
ncbi:MAG: dipeptidase [Chloroflexota bacterium]